MHLKIDYYSLQFSMHLTEFIDKAYFALANFKSFIRNGIPQKKHYEKIDYYTTFPKTNSNLSSYVLCMFVKFSYLFLCQFAILLIIITMSTPLDMRKFLFSPFFV